MIDRRSLQTGGQVRAACRSGQWTEQTSGLAPGYTQANLAILPQEFAYDFLQTSRTLYKLHFQKIFHKLPNPFYKSNFLF